MMFKVLVLQALYTVADGQTEYQLKDRLSVMRFVGLALGGYLALGGQIVEATVVEARRPRGPLVDVAPRWVMGDVTPAPAPP